MTRKSRSARKREIEESQADYRQVIATCREMTKNLPRTERLRAYQDCLKAMTRE